MGKKAKSEAPNPNHVANRETMQRLNFLYQASFFLNSLSASLDESEARSVHRSGHVGRKKRRPPSDESYIEKVSGSYIRSMNVVANKKVVKMDPAVKRTLCKGCNTVLVPGSTASVRVKTSRPHGHAVTYTCLTCGTSRRIPAPPILVSDGDAFLPSHPHGPTLSLSDATVVGSQSEHVSVEDRVEPNPGASQTVLAEQVARSSRKRKKRPPTPRIPHLFERDAGHIVFCGNERLNTED